MVFNQKKRGKWKLYVKVNFLKFVTKFLYFTAKLTMKNKTKMTNKEKKSRDDKNQLRTKTRFMLHLLLRDDQILWFRYSFGFFVFLESVIGKEKNLKIISIQRDNERNKTISKFCKKRKKKFYYILLASKTLKRIWFIRN